MNYDDNMKKILILFCFISLTEAAASTNNIGLVYGRQEGKTEWSDPVCLTYNPQYLSIQNPLPSQEKNAIRGLFKDFTPDYGCGDSSVYDGGSALNKIVAVARGNCTFVEKTDMAQQHQAKAVIVVSSTYVSPGINQTSDIHRFTIPTGTMLKSDFIKIQKLGKSVELMIYAPEVSDKFDPCMVVIFLLAVVCVAVGGFWSGLTFIDRQKKQEEKEKKKKEKKYVQSSDQGKDESEDEKDNEEHLDITVPAVIVFFVLVCAFLVLLYFFYDYLVFVIISLFCIAGSMGLYYCIQPVWKYIPIRTSIPKLPCCKSQPEVKNLILYALCATFAIVWAIERHESYAWVLQDILGLAFCINMLKTIQVPNLKICSILLILLFLYDIFFVFITPYFTKNGESIMVKVATGGASKSKEKLPMVFVVPKLNYSPYSSCLNQPSMLGFGDVIVPGLLVGYNHGIDLKVNSKKIYYIATVIAYGIGMIITFIALELMQTGQPALLYLVPCTLITTFVIGCIRGEFKLLWNGTKKVSVTENSENPPPQPENVISGPNTASVNNVNEEMSSTSTIDSENRSLIRK
ncbi:signal peptide peptidase-like 2B isoform X2 [Mytilus californianus]|uniref:signal peptide peptidase-like 2B isoform X2 n=1 Tax=Mytilus californianus TaxID=6549 RepID=UPI002245EE23|nr:signal peptide peptidase-like 2B isoform X2 [Mytilus californianus]